MRALASTGVVVIHVMALYMVRDPDAVWTPFYHVTSQLFKFSTQVFVFVSGAVLSYVYSGSRVPFGAFLLQRVRGTMMPFLIWSSAYYLLSGLYEMGAGTLLASVGSLSFWKQAAASILTGSASYHLYFVFMIFIFQLYLVYPILARMIDWVFRVGMAMAFASWYLPRTSPAAGCGRQVPGHLQLVAATPPRGDRSDGGRLSGELRCDAVAAALAYWPASLREHRHFAWCPASGTAAGCAGRRCRSTSWDLPRPLAVDEWLINPI